MPSYMQQPMPDVEMDALKRARLYAQTLREGAQKNIDQGGQMVGNIYVPNDTRGDYLKQALAGGLDFFTGRGEQDLTQKREQEFQDFLGKKPTAVMQGEVAGPPVPGQENEPVLGGVRKPLGQYATEVRDWATSAANIRHPLAQAIAARGLEMDLTAPEKALEREEKRAAANSEISHYETDPQGNVTGYTKFGKAIPLGTGGKVAAPNVTYTTNDAGNVTAIIRDAAGNITTQNVGNFGKTKAAAAAGGGASSGRLGKIQNKGLTPDGLPVSYSPLTGGYYVPDENGTLQPYRGEVVPTAIAGKEGAEKRSFETAVSEADALIEQTKSSPESFGVTPALASMLPNAIGSRITSASLTPDQQQVRANVMRNAAVIIHKIYGAALARGEEARANSWAISPTDDFDMTMAKLKSAREYAAGLGKSSGKVGGPAPAPAPAPAPTPKPALNAEAIAWVNDPKNANDPRLGAVKARLGIK